MSNDIKLGTTPSSIATRDAIHIAIAPVVADENLQRGTHVGLTSEGLASSYATPFVGIVDPFRSGPVVKGETFWLCLYQGTVTGMKHHWSHPAFTDKDVQKPLTEVEVSRQWLSEKAEGMGVSYERLIQCLKEDDYISVGENESYRGDSWADFAKHVEIAEGIKDAYPPFSCSC